MDLTKSSEVLLNSNNLSGQLFDLTPSLSETLVLIKIQSINCHLISQTLTVANHWSNIILIKYCYKQFYD